MHFVWYGQSCFKIIAKEATIIVDPFDRAITGLEPPRSRADAVLYTHKHSDHAAEYKQADFIISGPGEYEVKGVYFYGFPVPHDAVGGAVLGFSTAFLIEGDDLRVLHLGDFGAKQLTSEQIEEIGDVDILLVPIGGTYTLDAEGAEKMVRQIEPKVVIPMHYALPKLKMKLDSVDAFLREMGVEKKTPLPKYVIKKKELPPEGTEVVILESATGE